MIKILTQIVISIILGFSYQAYSQNFWETLPFPDSTDVKCISPNYNGHLFVGAGKIGNSGGLYRSGDSGQTWELVFDNGEFMIYPIQINDLGDIYIGKRGGNQLLVSYDNGDNWDTILYPGLGNITAIQTLGQDTILVSSWESNGAFLARSYNNGSTWDTVFTTNNSNEYIQDIINTDDGNIYIGLTSYSENAGGVYKSVDGGNTWMFSGLFNHMISSLEINSSDDIFASSRGILQVGLEPGLFVLRNGEDEWQVLVNGPFIEDVVTNSIDHIYYSSNSIYRSLDNGTTFEYIGNGLPSSPMGFMAIDDYGFLYLTSESSSNFLAKSINSTVSIYDIFSSENKQVLLYPNPVNNSFTVVKTSDFQNIDVIICIYDPSGKLHIRYKTTLCQNKLKVNVNSLPMGYYILEIIDHHTKSKETAKFIKY